MSAPPFRPMPHGQRIVICDYNALLLSVTGLLRMSGYRVFQAHDGHAAEELCTQLPDIALLVLNTVGSGVDNGQLIRDIRTQVLDLPVLHIGADGSPSLPADVPTLNEDFSPDELLMTVGALIAEN